MIQPTFIESPNYSAIYFNPLVATPCPIQSLVHTLVPSVVYQPKLVAPVFQNDLPVVGYTFNHVKTDMTAHSNTNIDDYIRKKVDEQIKAYESERKEAALKMNVEEKQEKVETTQKVETSSSTTSECRCNSAVGNLSIEEKIKLIRKELNLPESSDEKTETNNHHEWRRDFNRNVSIELTEVTKPNKAERHIDVIKPRLSRTKSADRTKPRRGKSPYEFISRPPWIPTGANDYTRTHEQRVDLLTNQLNAATKKSVSTSTDTKPSSYFITETKPAYDYYYYSQPKVYEYNYVKESKPSVLLTSTTSIPSKTTITTTIENKKTYGPTYSQLPALNRSEIVSFVRPSTAYYEKSPQSKVYNQSTSKYMIPIERTSNGTIYAKNNEIHYVSNNAKANLTRHASINPKYRITSGTTYIHD